MIELLAHRPVSPIITAMWRQYLQHTQYRNGLRLLLLSLIITVLRPAPLHIVPGPQQTVVTTHPKLAVHTRLTDEVEAWKIKRSLEMVREMGATAIVEFFPWAYYHAENGSFAWDHPDLVIEHARAQGLVVYARLGLTPEWARPEETAIQYLDESGYAAFADYAVAFAERYRGEVDYLIIWNEPNLSFEWGYRPTTAADYVALLAEVYPRVKAVNPEIIVLAGAMAPTLEPAGSPWGLNDLTYLEQMYAAGGADYFDELAVHTYGLTFPPDVAADPNVLNFRRVELIYDIMVANGDGDSKIHITEAGWNDHPRWTLAVRPSQRIQYTLDAIEIAESEWPYVERLGFWMFRTPAPIKSYMDYYTFVTPEFIAKPLYVELQRFTGNAPYDELP